MGFRYCCCVSLRRQLGLAGLFVLGLVYGIFNEGIIAKTFYLATNVPINKFDGYGYVLALPFHGPSPSAAGTRCIRSCIRWWPSVISSRNSGSCRG